MALQLIFWSHWLTGIAIKAALVLVAARIIVAIVKIVWPEVTHLVLTLACLVLLSLTLINGMWPSLQIGLFPKLWYGSLLHATETIHYEPSPSPNTDTRRCTQRIDLFPSIQQKNQPLKPVILLLFWLAGFVITTIRFLAGMTLAELSTKRGRACIDYEWTKIANQLALTLQIRRKVIILKSRQLAPPMVWGFFKPRILLPAEAADWSEERLQFVLLHELAHIKRLDWNVQMCALFVTSFHWYNPLAWWMFRQLKKESERASDLIVTRQTRDPAKYADHLLSLARFYSKARHAHPAIGFLTPAGDFESRLKAILNSSSSPGKERIFGKLVVCLPCLALMLGISAIDSPSDLRGRGPFSVETIEKRFSDYKGGMYYQEKVINAFKEDGSWEWRVERFSNKTSRKFLLYTRENINAKKNRHSNILPNQGTVDPMKEVSNKFPMQNATSCVGWVDIQQSKRLGLTLMKNQIKLSTGAEIFLTEQWLAKQLNCYPLLERTYRVFSSGSRELVQTREVSSITLGQSD